jgi:LacI family transcriptional regulator
MSGLTLEDIARKAGVSRSTASRVVNHHPHVSDGVRKRVLQVIQENGYQPHAAARTLASQRSWMIGLIVPQTVSALFTDTFYPHLTQGIASACNDNNYTLSLFLVSTREDEEDIFPRVARKGFLDGLLVQSGQIGDQLIEKLMRADIPLVIIGRPFHPKGISYVDVDNVNAAREAVTHLISLGYKRVGTIAGPSNTTVGIDRLEGYLKALKDNSLSVDESLIVESDFTEQDGYQAMQKLLPVKPRAVFAASDIIALGAMRAVKEAGLRVPEDVAFVGFDDQPLSTKPDPELTTIHQPVYRLGGRAVETLIDLIENGNDMARTTIMETQLIVRQSCGAASKGRNCETPISM